MKILVLGAAGYLGWPTAMMFARLGHEVVALDSNEKFRVMRDLGIATLNSPPKFSQRVLNWNELSGAPIAVRYCDLLEPGKVAEVIGEVQPEAIVHYAEQGSAPYSMMNADHAAETQLNNVIGTLRLMFAVHEKAPGAHIVKLGTMGEYGTPNIPIGEGWLDVEVGGVKDRVLFPKRPGSFYHLSKVHDSHNLEFGCRVWDMAVTDLNQGVVYGFETPEMALAPGLETNIYYDSIFGTALNRFICQLVAGLPLSVYGEGKQKRAFLNINDTLQCVRLAVETPAEPGEFRVMNQFTEVFSILQLAKKVLKAGKKAGLAGRYDTLENPRVEAAEHPYDVEHTALPGLGLVPQKLTEGVLVGMIETARFYQDNINPAVIDPNVDWRAGYADKP